MLYSSAPRHDSQKVNPTTDRPSIGVERAWGRGTWLRYGRVSWFFFGLTLHLLWWDFFLQLPILRWFSVPPRRRWPKLARRYCGLATHEGGLLVKLGQFLSLRFDLLPAEVIEELTSLQDSVPAAPYAAIRAVVEADLGSPLSQLFPWFAMEPLASASVAQVHLARLHSGEEIVVKVLRPDTARQFEMDLAVIGVLVRWLNYVGKVRDRIDLPVLLNEFTVVTLRELDLFIEATNIERFTRAFADDAHVYIPKVYWQYSGRHTLTMENVGFLKLNDLDGIEATGIQLKEIATELARIFLQQIFFLHFVHADPHPGNVFIRPLPLSSESREAFAPGERVAYQPNRPFQIVLIDFGMTVAIPPKAQTWLREFLIGLGLRDSRRIVQSYVSGGLLRPDAEIERVEEMTADVLDGFQDMLIGMMPNFADPRTRRFFQKYDDIAQNYPFQIPMDLLFMYRALGTVGGTVKQFDADFDLSAAAAPFALQMFVEEWQGIARKRIHEFNLLGQLLLASPIRVDQLLLQAHRAFQIPDAMADLVTRPWRDMRVKTELTPRDRQTFQHLEGSIQRLNRSMIAIGVIVGGILFYTSVQNGGVGALVFDQAVAHWPWLCHLAASCGI